MREPNGKWLIAAEAVKYGMASALAFALDYGTMLYFYQVVRLNYLLAAAVGFMTGLVVVYLVSIRYIFAYRRRVNPAREFVEFFAIGLIGLALNEALMWGFVEQAGLAVALAKIPAAGVVFIFNFTTRRCLLFSATSWRESALRRQRQLPGPIAG